MGSGQSFAAQSTNGRNAENRPFAALVANVSVAGHCVLSLQVRKNQPLDELIDTKGGLLTFAASEKLHR